MEGSFRDLIEGVTGRKVVAFFSQAHFDPDMAAEVFVLEEDSEPRETTGDGR